MKKEKSKKRESTEMPDETSQLEMVTEVQEQPSVASEESVVLERKSKKKKKRKAKDTSDDDDAEESTTNMKKSKKRKAIESEEIPTKKLAYKNTATDDDVEQGTVDEVANETVTKEKSKKKKKKDKKDKKKTKTPAEEAETVQEKKAADDHVPTEIGEVDTDILEQASINLGLPLADKAEEASATKEKPKKKKKKDKKGKSEANGDSSSQGEDKNPDAGAVSYLKLWHSDRKSWKFNKRLQIRLIHNMYSKDKLNDEDFETLLLYLDGMQGKGREKTRDDAGKIVKEESEDADVDTQERARQIFQMLS